MQRNTSDVPSATRISMERIRLTLFITRHIIGVGIFIWLTIASFQAKSMTLGYLFATATPIYAGFAFYSGQKLLRRYQILQAKFRAGGIRVAR
jgi:hypothetical protein